MLKVSHQHYNPHSMPICNTPNNCHQPTSTCPCIQPAHTSPMSCTQHLIITAAQPCLALQPPSPHTRNQQLSHQCHAPPCRVSTTCCCPSSQPSLPTMALGHHVEQGASTCCPSSQLIDPTRVGRLSWSPSKSP